MATAHPRFRRHARPGVHLVLAAAIAISGCGGAKNADDADSAGARAPGAPGTTASPAATADPSACPLTGAWRTCSVQDRLEKAGLAPQLQPEPVRRPGFGVPGARFAIGKASLEVFLYPSADARLRDVAALDSATASPRGAATDWPDPPTLMGSGNMAAVLYGARERQVERVALALTAGLPQR